VLTDQVFCVGEKPVTAVTPLDAAALHEWISSTSRANAGPLRTITQFKGGSVQSHLPTRYAAGSYVLATQPFGKLLRSAHAVSANTGDPRTSAADLRFPSPTRSAKIHGVVSPFYVLQHIA